MQWALYVLIAIAVVVIASELSKARRDKELARQAALAEDARIQAKEGYEAALERLKADPRNASCRQEALSKGREYSNLARNEQGVTLYDEVAIKNDLDAATAGA